MHTSNKIIVLIIALIVAFLTIAHTTVYTKDKNKEFVDEKLFKQYSEAKKFTTTALKKFTNISIDSTYGVLFAYAADYKVLVRNENANNVIISQVGDKLNISSKTYHFDGFFMNEDNPQIVVYSPMFNSICSKSSSMYIDTFPAKKLPQINIDATDATIYFGKEMYGSIVQNNVISYQFDSLTAELKGASSLHLRNFIDFQKLNLKMKNTSSLDLVEPSKIHSFNVEASDSTFMSIPTRFLKYVKYTSSQ